MRNADIILIFELKSAQYSARRSKKSIFIGLVNLTLLIEFHVNAVFPPIEWLEIDMWR